MSQLWDTIHKKYSRKDWIDKPSLFSEWVIQYFLPSGKILELGAGQGADSRFFVTKGFHVTSTDYSEEALKQSKEKSKDMSNLNIKFLDIAESFPFEDSSFDIVYANLSLHYFSNEKTKQIFEEIYRVLKQNGILALLLNSTNDPEYNTGRKIEEDYFEIQEGFNKRYFSVNSILNFTKEKFKTLIADDKGESYKDNAAGVRNLIRFLGKKI